jgi:N-hydroxyarylamine O-acetyltransferase
MDIKAYLNRINYHGALAPSADTLRELQIAHLLAVPFENLSIHSGEPIILDDQALFEKIVARRRGGYCYELNGLFAALLRSLGFKVEMLSAGVANSEAEFGPDFDHMTLLVTLEQRWLADVGFGDSFLEPLLLDERGIQSQGERSYRIVPEGDYLILSQRETVGEWQAQYRFSLQPHRYADYAEMCHYHQTSPDSHFTKARICSRATPDGRVTLSGMRLITTTREGGREEVAVADNDAYAQLLSDHFGIDLNLAGR